MKKKTDLDLRIILYIILTGAISLYERLNSSTHPLFIFTSFFLFVIIKGRHQVSIPLFFKHTEEYLDDFFQVLRSS